MTVPAGGVHGFLGPNGSGKTTTIRMLLGLIRPDSGTAGSSGDGCRRSCPRSSTGSARSSSHRSSSPFTGRQNLRLLADAIGTPRPRIDEVLEVTHLGDRGRDRYAGYSLGMKQRLAIAATLLKDPELLIFDEPTNGLDPAGIREVRDTMRTLGRAGKTILVSSHILAEVEQVADTVTIIGHGRTLAEGAVSEILGGGGAPQVRLGISSPGQAEDVSRQPACTSPVTASTSSSRVRRTPPRSPGSSPATACMSGSSRRSGRTSVRLPLAHRRRRPRLGSRSRRRRRRAGGAA